MLPDNNFCCIVKLEKQNRRGIIQRQILTNKHTHTIMENHLKMVLLTLLMACKEEGVRGKIFF